MKSLNGFLIFQKISDFVQKNSEYRTDFSKAPHKEKSKLLDFKELTAIFSTQLPPSTRQIPK